MSSRPQEDTVEDAVEDAVEEEGGTWEERMARLEHYTRYEDTRDLLRASFEGGISRADWLLTNGADVNQQDKDGNTPLIMAAMGGRGDMMNMLIYAKRKSCNVDHQNNQGKTALMSLMGNGFYEGDWEWMYQVTRMLLREGRADPNLVDKDGNTALVLAENEPHITFVGGRNPLVELLKHYNATYPPKKKPPKSAMKVRRKR